MDILAASHQPPAGQHGPDSVSSFLSSFLEVHGKASLWCVQYIQWRASNALQANEVRETSDEREHRDREHRRNEASLLPAIDTIADVSSNFIEPTCHELESKASAVEWAAVHDCILTAVTGAAAMPVSQICLNCRNSASFHCQ